jgi:hypothetical protein
MRISTPASANRYEASRPAQLLVPLPQVAGGSQKLADKNFELLQRDARHPSLHLKKVKERIWSARVGLHYRALAVERDDCLAWNWIGHHSEYERLIQGS